MALRWQTLCSSTLLVLPSCTVGLKALQAEAVRCSLSVLNYTWMGAEGPNPACACASTKPCVGQCQHQ